MNGGRHHGPIDIGGCFTEIWYGFLVLAVFFAIVAATIWVFSKPNDVCVKWETIKVIEQTDIGSATDEILRDKRVCTEYGPSPLPSPFLQFLEWATP